MIKSTKAPSIKQRHQKFDEEKDESSNDSNDELKNEAISDSEDESKDPNMDIEDAEEQIKSIPFSQLSELKKNGAASFKPRDEVKTQTKKGKDGETKKPKNA